MIFSQIAFNKVIQRLDGVNNFFLVLITVVIAFVVVVLLTIPDTVDNPVSLMRIPVCEKILLVCIITPIFETLLFQKLVINLAIKYKNDKILALFISALLFALVHDYSVLYILKMFIVGLLFGFLYIILNHKNPTLHVIIAHSLYNSIALFISFFVQNNQ